MPIPIKQSRPWGNELWIGVDPVMVKILTVSPHQSLSLQSLKLRDESWFVLSGYGEVQLDGKSVSLTPQSTVAIPRTITHRLSASDQPLVILELSYGKFDQNDIIRLKDDYGRAS
jgi:mannose-6-phosphate isomerase-like protein (cupin superfamily)